jgi:hypothetical protein|tara:strand:- start:310 stop:1542 length:1233 start_codon:yes stop_codon:yes gene_type:complete
MAVNKGLKSLAGTTPNFSNQGLENAVNELKIGWVIKGSQLDTAIQDNVVLTTSQKNDLKSTIHNIQYLNLGRVFGDLVRHTNTILDGTIVFLANPDTEDTADFLEILQTVQSIQTLIPNLYGVSAGEFSRDVNDHLGTLNNKFLETEDSSAPVFTSLRESLDFITAANLSEETALETAYDNLRNFINSVVADSTDFQQTLNTFASAVATAHTNLNTALASEPYLTKRTQLSIDQDKIEAQVALETSNLSRIRDYVNGLTNHISFTSLAEDEQLRALMTRISQNADWANYFREYEKNSANINPIYSVGSDSDKTTIIDTILRDSGLPDVLDFVDLEAVANKAKKDSRIDTAGFDRFTVEQQITDACRQLDIKTANRSIYNQSESLLDNLNQRDRDLVANRLDLNQDAETLS